MSTTDLSNKMRALAKKGHPRAAELLDLAIKFDKAAKGFHSTPQTVTVKSFVGAWVRARKLWCAVSGEPLI